jgi:hypothetical protein
MSMSVEVEQSRAIPVTREQAFRGIIEMNVPVVFRRRYGPIPPIRRVSGRDGGNWAGTVGQTRVLELGGGGSITETVVSVDEPRPHYPPSAGCGVVTRDRCERSCRVCS